MVTDNPDEKNLYKTFRERVTKPVFSTLWKLMGNYKASKITRKPNAIWNFHKQNLQKFFYRWRLKSLMAILSCFDVFDSLRTVGPVWTDWTS